MVNRRELLAGGLAIGASSLIAGPTWTKPLDLTESRIFGFTEDGVARLLRTNIPKLTAPENYYFDCPNFFEGPKNPQWCFEIVDVPVTAKYPHWDSIRKIEDWYMTYCPAVAAFETMSNGILIRNQNGVPYVVFRINVAANNIAKSTRRGRGNNIICSPNTHELLKEYMDQDYCRFHPKYKFHVDDSFPDNKVFVFYRGTNKYDVAGKIFPDFSLALNQSHSGYYHDYGRRVMFREEHRYSLPYLKKHGLVMT